MRVICINDKWQAAPGCEDAPRPIFMQSYTALETKTLEGIEVHVLSEMGDRYAYQTNHFATFPDTPAEVIEEEEPEMVTV